MNLSSIEGIGPVTEGKLNAAGITDVVNLADADATILADKTGLAESRLLIFIERARNHPNMTSEPSEDVTLLSGGNPQIAKGDGPGPVEAYLEAMPGWKRSVGRNLDDLIERTVPDVRKAVRWNSPFYGIEDSGWFLSFHCITKYVKVTFFRGTSLEPNPPVYSKRTGVRYFHIYEDDVVDEELLTNWISQASELPGEELF